MNKINNNFENYLKENLKDDKFREYFNEHSKQLEIAYKILQLRNKVKMSQTDLANKIGTSQSNVARMEAGQQNFTTHTLQKVAEAFELNLKVDFAND